MKFLSYLALFCLLVVSACSHHKKHGCCGKRAEVQKQCTDGSCTSAKKAEGCCKTDTKCTDGHCSSTKKSEACGACAKDKKCAQGDCGKDGKPCADGKCQKKS